MKVLSSPDIASYELMMHLVILVERWDDVKEAMDYIEEEIINVVNEYEMLY
jgi:hypothetical protein